MKTANKYFLVLILLLLVGLTTVSATENTTDTSQTHDISVENDITDQVITDTAHDNNIQINNNAIKKDNNIINNTKKAKTASTITITNSTYDYFYDPITDSEYVKTTDMIKDGDTINLKGNFYNLKFAVDKKLTFTSLDYDAHLYNCTVYVLGQNQVRSFQTWILKTMEHS